MDELIDILDTYGKPTGTTALKSKAHRLGLFHATVHIWFYTDDGKILLQQRGEQKITYPLLWDVSVAGHIGAGEKIGVSAIREIEEEIGLQVQEEDLIKIGVFKSMQKHHDTLIDNEFHHTFLCELKVPLHLLQKQESEVADLKIIPIENFDKEINAMVRLQKYVPHSLEYHQTVINEIEKRI